MTEKRDEAVACWRDHLSEEDEAEINKWVMQSGLERVARIMSILANANAEPGRVKKPYPELLLRMSRMKLEDRGATNRSLAREVVNSQEGRTRVAAECVEPENLVTALRDKFNEQQHALNWLVQNTPPATTGHAGRNTPASSPLMDRILGRIIEVSEAELNAYDALMTDAAALGPDRVELIRNLGRHRVDEMLTRRIKEQVSGLCSSRRTPRNFYELIAVDLAELAPDKGNG